MKRKYSIVVVLLLAATCPAAQTPQQRPAGPPSFESPEVLADGRVIFRFFAPKVSEVLVSGDFRYQVERSVGALAKDDQGLWSLTIGPLKPDFYTYSFTVDGVRTQDPRNPYIKPAEPFLLQQGLSSIDSIFEVPGGNNAFAANRPVPHGEVRMVWYQSRTLDRQRSMHVYTPPGYDSSRESYPALYIISGGDSDAGWSTAGRAGFILDNLLAEGKAKPMLIVMPENAASRDPKIPMARLGQPGFRSELLRRGDLFGDELFNDIIPFVEKNYRVISDPNNRAMAGLSNGGGQTIWFGLPRIDVFAYIGILSAGTSPEGSDELVERAPEFFSDPDETNRKVKLIWVAAGELEAGGDRSKSNFLRLLDERGIKSEFQVIKGSGHDWITWRDCLHQLAQRLFQ